MIYFYQIEKDEIVKYRVTIDYDALAKLNQEIIAKCSFIEKIFIEKLKYLPELSPYIKELSYEYINQDNEYCNITYKKYTPPKLTTYITSILSTKEYYCLSKNYSLKDILFYEANECLTISPNDILSKNCKSQAEKKELLTLNANQEQLQPYYYKVLSLIDIKKESTIKKEDLDIFINFFDNYDITELINNLISDKSTPKKILKINTGISHKDK